MELFLDCLPCLLRQALEAARLTTDSAPLQRQVMDEALRLLCARGDGQSAPALAAQIHGAVRRICGADDPYAALKARSVAAALACEPQLRAFLDGKKEDRLYWALKVAVTGNVIDAGISLNCELGDRLESELAQPFVRCDLDAFAPALAKARTLLLIADNAGETVYDRVFAGELPASCRVRYAVRGAPVLNDATRADALASGWPDSALLESGCGAPGTLLERCSPAFLEAFAGADLVVCKGQGNYEALSACGRPVYFLLKAKCPRIAQSLGVPLGAYVFARGGTAPAQEKQKRAKSS